MSAFTVVPMPAAEPSRAWANSGQALLRLAKEFCRWRRVRRDLSQLRGFDDRMLADIGLGRSEIDSLVHGEDRVDGIRGRLIAG